MISNNALDYPEVKKVFALRIDGTTLAGFRNLTWNLRCARHHPRLCRKVAHA